MKYKKEKFMRKKSELKNVLDQFFVVQQEMITGKGEDSYLLDVKEDEAAAGVFDGCGGSGAKIYANLGNHTGAYIASRTLSQAVYSWFETQYKDAEKEGKAQAQELKNQLDHYLQELKKYGGAQGGLRGSIIKDFPSTLAFSTLSLKKQMADINFYWCGDSRGLILDRDGLHQLTRDDTEDSDAMANLTECAPMNNLVSASADYEIHRRNVFCKLPCIILTATDGCFDTLNSPMEFEKLLLKTLDASESTIQWKKGLQQEMETAAGDDYTMTVLIAGFGSFQKLKEYFSDRLSYMMDQFPLSKNTSIEDLWKQWEIYRKGYEKYIKEPE